MIEASMANLYAGNAQHATAGANPQKVAAQFESMFYRMLFEQMRNENTEDPLLSGPEADQMKAMFHDELAGKLGGMNALGIKEMIETEIASRQGLIKEMPHVTA